MKADRCGAWAEQSRYKLGWMTASERKQKGINGKCGDCANLDQDHGARCKKGDFATRVACVCNNFEERTAEII